LINSYGKVIALERDRPANAPGVYKGFVERKLHEHLRGAIGAAPDDGSIGQHVSGLDAEWN
jgi:hypothetical protein